MNRYNYNSNRRRNYGSRPNTTNGSSAVVTLVFIVISLIIWILTLKANVTNISDRNFNLKKENDSLIDRIELLSKKPEPIKVPVLEIIPKRIFKKPIKDTVKVKPVIIQEVKPVITDTTKI